MAGTTDKQPDRILIERANRGDDAAFELLYGRYRDWVISAAMRFTRTREDALDVAQETFLWLMRRFPGFELRADMKTVLYPVLRNLAIARLRKQRTREKHARPYAETTQSSGAQANRTGQDNPADALQRVLGGLSEIHREVLYLRYVDDLDHREIAAALDVPVGTVKSRLHHALAALREHEMTKKYFSE